MRRTAEFLIFVLAASACIIAVNVLFFEGAVSFLASMLVDVIVYSWSRRFPDERLAFFGLVEFNSSWLPYVLLIWASLLRGTDTVHFDLIANGIGHVLWYIADVVPLVLGVRPLAPGDFLTDMFHRLGLGRRHGGGGNLNHNNNVHLQEFDHHHQEQQQQPHVE